MNNKIAVILVLADVKYSLNDLEKHYKTFCGLYGDTNHNARLTFFVYVVLSQIEENFECTFAHKCICFYILCYNRYTMPQRKGY